MKKARTATMSVAQEPNTEDRTASQSILTNSFLNENVYYADTDKEGNNRPNPAESGEDGDKSSNAGLSICVNAIALIIKAVYIRLVFWKRGSTFPGLIFKLIKVINHGL